MIGRDCLPGCRPAARLHRADCPATRPHEFVGRIDRACEICGFPDRAAVHVYARTPPALTGRMTAINRAIAEVTEEVIDAMTKHPTFNSPHEGHSVIREEFEEIWKHVLEDTGRGAEARAEAMQTAAMAIRYMVDLTEPS